MYGCEPIEDRLPGGDQLVRLGTFLSGYGKWLAGPLGQEVDYLFASHSLAVETAFTSKFSDQLGQIARLVARRQLSQGSQGGGGNFTVAREQGRRGSGVDPRTLGAWPSA